jgi:hypothetical protein
MNFTRPGGAFPFLQPVDLAAGLKEYGLSGGSPMESEQ